MRPRLDEAPTDNALIGMGAQSPSLEEVYRRYARYVAATALRLGGRSHEIDDFVHDVFLVVARRLKDLRRADALRPWLVGITVRIVRRRLRQRRLRGFFGLDQDSSYARIPGARMPASDRLLLTSVYRALDSLPVNERLAWSLRYIEGEKIEAVARACRCSLATAKRRIAAARSKIEEALGEA